MSVADRFAMFSPNTSVSVSGDKQRAKECLGEAYRLLYQTRMNAQHQNVPIYRMERELAGGVKISALIANGREYVNVFVPQKGGEPEEDGIYLYLRGYLNPPTVDDENDVYFLLDFDLNFKKVRQRINKHLFIENVAAIGDYESDTSVTDTVVSTTTDMTFYVGGPWVEVDAGTTTTTTTTRQTASYNGTVLWTGTASSTTASTVTNDYPAGGDVQHVHQETDTSAIASSTKMPLVIYGTPYIGPVSFSYDYNMSSSDNSVATWTRTWDPDETPPRWWNPVTLDIENNNIAYSMNATPYISIGAEGWDVLPGTGIDVNGIVGANTAAAVRKGPKWYEKLVDGELVKYAEPSKGDVLLTAFSHDGRLNLIRIYRGNVLIRTYPIRTREYKGNTYTLLDVRGGEAPLRLCEFGVCHLIPDL